MDSNGGPEKSLPGMGMPRWMKKTERYNYSDICASPPSNEDGFLHINRHRLQESTNSASEGQTNVECFQNKKKAALRAEATPEMIPSSAAAEFSMEPHQFGRGSSIILAKQDCAALKETSNFYKTISTTSASSLVSLALASQEGMMAHPKQKSGTTNEVSLHAKTKPTVAPEFDAQSLTMKKATLDSAPPPEERSLNVARRTGNPFFSGSQDKPNSGSWLFRSSSPPVPSNKSSKVEEHGSNLYDTKLEKPRPLSAGPGGANVTPSQNVRYVPRPSELRELNFWSPTSM